MSSKEDCLKVVRRNKEKIQRNIENYLRHKGLTAKEIFLFQSRVTGECRPSSDIDIYIQLDERHQKLVEEKATFWGNRRDLHWKHEFAEMGYDLIGEEWVDPNGNIIPIRVEICLGIHPDPPCKDMYKGRDYYMKLSDV